MRVQTDRERERGGWEIEKNERKIERASKERVGMKGKKREKTKEEKRNR